MYRPKTMRDINALIEEIRDLPIRRLEAGDWNGVFEKLHHILQFGNIEARDFTLRMLANIIGGRLANTGDDRHAISRTRCERLAAVLQLLESRPDVIECLNEFTARGWSFRRDEGLRLGFLKWIEAFIPALAIRAAWPDAALAFRIRLGAFGADWHSASEALIGFLEHSSLRVRAISAHQLGRICRCEKVESERLLEVMDLIGRTERSHPGIAGPFFGMVRDDLHRQPGDAESRSRLWMLDIIGARTSPEPDVFQYDLCGIDYYARELFAEHPEDIRKLMALGRPDIAVLAASNKKREVEGIAKLLDDLGNLEDPFICCSASWHLSHFYRTLHKHGAERGFVAQYRTPDGSDIFVNSNEDNKGHPHSVTVWAPPALSFSSAQSWHWIDGILPESIRGDRVPWRGEVDCWDFTEDGGSIHLNTVNYSWATRGTIYRSSRATVVLEGEPPDGPWNRIMIVRHGSEGLWHPQTILAEIPGIQSISDKG